MDREGAQLIQILYSRAESFPYLGVVLAICAAASVGLLLSLVKIWLPKKAKIVQEVKSTENTSAEEKKEDKQAA